MNNSDEIYKELYDNNERLKTGYGNRSKTQNFYLFLEGDDETGAGAFKKYYNGKTEIFITALLLGYFYNKKSDVYQPDSFIRINTLGNQYFDGILKMILTDLCLRQENSGKTAKEMLTELCKYADGGIEILQEHFQANGKLDMTKINNEIQERIAEKAEEIKSRLN